MGRMGGACRSGRRRGAALLLALAACKATPAEERGARILHLGLRAQVGSLDPARSGQHPNGLAQALVYEPLLEYDPVARPLELRPLLLERMPEVSEDGLTHRLTLKEGVRFADDPCFPNGAGRLVTAHDVAYAIKRLADRDVRSTGWWLFADRIRGLDAFKAAQDQRPAGAPFDPEVPVEGLQVVDERRLQLHLTAPHPQLLYVFAMGYAAPVPREAVTHYGAAFATHPVGTGPFVLTRRTPGLELAFARNPRYHGAPPRLEGVVLRVFEQDQPLWLAFRAGDLDLIQVPAEFQPLLRDASRRLRPRMIADGVRVLDHPLLDLTYRGFDLEHPITGGFGAGKKLRQAIDLALDLEELGDAFFDGAIQPYEGPIPPGLEGHKPRARRRADLSRARALLAEAGYPHGEGLPPIAYHTNRGGNAPEQAELLSRQLAAIGVRLEVHLHSFPELDRRIRQGEAQMFQLAWISDYPDPENNLALFYGPNRRPGANVFAYARPEYDALFERARVMPPSAERTAIYEALRDMVAGDVPYAGGFARTRVYASNRRLRPITPDETWWTWLRFAEVEPR